MPELPEVEIVRRGLEPVMAGSTIARVEQRRADLRFPFPHRFVERLEGQAITAIDRRAKYLLVHLAGGDVLVIHLGMSGRLSVAHAPIALACSPEQQEISALACSPVQPAASRDVRFGDYVYDTGALPAHDHVVITLTSGARITYNDPRRFGFMLLIPGTELEQHALFAKIGVEPLGNAFNAAHLAAKAHGRRTDLKAFLLDQRVVAGLGNIYVSEALHRARLSPRREAGCLATRAGRPTERAQRLVPEIRAVLTAAIAAGGSSLRDYRHTDGTSGGFQNAFNVYGRDGEPCLRAGCTGIVQRTVQAQRATFACPTCQR